jgi:hypothetical protein
MEAHWIAERAALRCLARHHPTWTPQELAGCLGCSRSWVKQWLGRLNPAPPEDLTVPHARSRARHTPPPALSAAVVERILAIRDAPPEGLQRVPGPRAIRYELPRDPVVPAPGLKPPRSTTTVWKVLRQQGRILPERRRSHAAEERPPPLEEVQMDCKDASTVPAAPDGTRPHVVEGRNFRRQYGVPRRMTFDRAPRWVGSPSGRDFPSALVRRLRCLGIEPQVCPPHRPDRNAFVERYHRAYREACWRVLRPGPEGEVREATEAYRLHYHTERPHQGRSCGHVPPRVAFPTLPTLPALPEVVDPDRWLDALDGQAFARTVRPNGTVRVDLHPSYVLLCRPGVGGPPGGAGGQRRRPDVHRLARRPAAQAARHQRRGRPAAPLRGLCRADGRRGPRGVSPLAPSPAPPPPSLPVGSRRLLSRSPAAARCRHQASEQGNLTRT